MKIAHVICSFPPYKGGMGNSTLRFAEYLTAFRNEVTVLTPYYDNRSQSALASEWLGKVEILRIKPLISYGNAGLIPALWSMVNDYDVIHLHYPFYGAAAIVATRRLLDAKFKLVVHYHMDTRAGGWKGLIFWFYRHIFLGFVLRAADAVTCASLDYLKHSDAAKYYQKWPKKFAQVPFGVDAKFFSPLPFVERKKQIMFVGGLDRPHYFKGVDVLLKAFASLGERLLDYHLVIVGKGDLLDGYKQIASNLNIGARVEFVDDADDNRLAQIYRESRLLVLPSINSSEAFGLVLLEAMASGLPVIASNLPGVRSVFRNNEQGLLIAPGDVEDLAKKIWQMVSNEKRLEKMGEEARALVESRYTWEKAAQKLNDLFYRIKYSPTTVDNQDDEL